VNPDCSLPGRPDVYAIGDMVSLNKLPGVAQPALQEGKYVAKAITARLDGEEVKPFKYFDKGSMATIGYKSAVADAFGVLVTGWIAYLMWAFIHVLYLVGWGNRVGTLYTWSRAMFFSKQRPHRIITFEGAHDNVEEGQTRSRPAPILPASQTAAESIPSTNAEAAQKAG